MLLVGTASAANSLTERSCESVLSSEAFREKWPESGAARPWVDKVSSTMNTTI
jgi:hypothetical protein